VEQDTKSEGLAVAWDFFSYERGTFAAKGKFSISVEFFANGLKFQECRTYGVCSTRERNLSSAENQKKERFLTPRTPFGMTGWSFLHKL
jgi:hypothetical protein